MLILGVCKLILIGIDDQISRGLINEKYTKRETNKKARH
jgi:hypothetical protein